VRRWLKAQDGGQLNVKMAHKKGVDGVVCISRHKERLTHRPNSNPNYEGEKDMNELPTWHEIFNVAGYAKPYKPALKMMQKVEDAGHGSSVERHLLDLVVNYNRNTSELKARVLDMLYGDYLKPYSYQGWDTLSTRVLSYGDFI